MKQSQSKRLQNAATATGNGEVFNVSGFSALSIQVVGTFTGTVQFEGSNDGTTYSSVPFYNASGSVVSSATAGGIFTTTLCGYSLLRTRVSAYTSGTIDVFSSGNG